MLFLLVFLCTALGLAEHLRSGYFSNKENTRRIKVTHPYGALTVQFRAEKKKLLDKQFDIVTGNLTSFAISARSKTGRSEKFTFSIISDRKLKVSVSGHKGAEMWYHRPFAHGAIDDALLLESEVSMLSEAQRHVLADFSSGKRTKRNVELVIAAYDENVTWAHMYSHLTTVYVKGELVYVPVNGNQLSRVVALPNVGRETHTYLTHIVRNYDSLADVTVFTQGESPTQGYQGHRKGGGHMFCDVTLHDYILGNSSSSLFVMTEMMHMHNALHVVRKGYNGGSCLRKRGTVPNTGTHHLLSAASAATLPNQCFGDNDAEAFLLPSRNHPVTVHIMGDTCKRDKEDGCTPYGFWDKYIRLPRPEGGLVWYAQGAVFAASREDIRRRSRADYERLLKVASLGKDTSTGFFMEYFWHPLVTSERHACDHNAFSTKRITKEALAAPPENALSFAELSDILRSREKNETTESESQGQGQGQGESESSQQRRRRLQNKNKPALQRGIYRLGPNDAIKVEYDEQGRLIVHHRGAQSTVEESDEEGHSFTVVYHPQGAKGAAGKGPAKEKFNIVDSSLIKSNRGEWRLVRNSPRKDSSPSPYPKAEEGEPPVEQQGEGYVCQHFPYGCCKGNSSLITEQDVQAADKWLRRLGASCRKVALIGDSSMVQLFDFLVLIMSHYQLSTSLQTFAINVTTGVSTLLPNDSSCVMDTHTIKSEIHRPGQPPAKGPCQTFHEAYFPLHDVRIRLAPGFRVFVPESFLPANEQQRSSWIHSPLFFQTILPSTLEDTIRSADCSLTNFGIHYEAVSGIAYLQGMRYTLSVLQAENGRNSSRRHAFRATQPLHFKSRGGEPQGFGSWELANSSRSAGCASTALPHWTDLLATSTLRTEYPDVPLVRNYELLKGLGHLHGDRQSKILDCVHWCFHPGLFNSIWSDIVQVLTTRPAAPVAFDGSK